MVLTVPLLLSILILRQRHQQYDRIILCVCCEICIYFSHLSDVFSLYFFFFCCASTLLISLLSLLLMLWGSVFKRRLLLHCLLCTVFHRDLNSFVHLQRNSCETNAHSAARVNKRKTCDVRQHISDK